MWFWRGKVEVAHNHLLVKEWRVAPILLMALHAGTPPRRRSFYCQGFEKLNPKMYGFAMMLPLPESCTLEPWRGCSQLVRGGPLFAAVAVDTGVCHRPTEYFTVLRLAGNLLLLLKICCPRAPLLKRDLQTRSNLRVPVTSSLLP